MVPETSDPVPVPAIGVTQNDVEAKHPGRRAAGLSLRYHEEQRGGRNQETEATLRTTNLVMLLVGVLWGQSAGSVGAASL